MLHDDENYAWSKKTYFLFPAAAAGACPGCGLSSPPSTENNISIPGTIMYHYQNIQKRVSKISYTEGYIKTINK